MSETVQPDVAEAFRDPGHSSDHLPAGSPHWWGHTVGRNVLLFAIPVAPLVIGVKTLVWPTMTVNLSDAQKQGLAIRSDGLQTSVRQVEVALTDPGLLDRVLLAVPSLVFAVLLVMVVHALFRIEVNMTGHTRPFTVKDAHVFRRAVRWLNGGWWVMIAFEIAATLWFRLGPADVGGARVPLNWASWLVLCGTYILIVVSRIYMRGARAYAELEKGV